MRKNVRPPSPLDGDKAQKPNSSPQKEAGGSITLKNQAYGHTFKDTFDVQENHKKAREQREKMANKAAVKTTEEFIKKVIEQHKRTLLEAEFAY